MAVELARAAHGTMIPDRGAGYPVGCARAAQVASDRTGHLVARRLDSACGECVLLGRPIRKTARKLRNF